MIIHVLKIDSLRKTVEAIEVENGLYPMYAALGQDFIERVPAPFRSPCNDSLLVDGESLIRKRDPAVPLTGFVWQGFPNQVLFGHGIVVGVVRAGRREGDWTHCTTSVEEMTKMVFFPDQQTLDDNYALLTGRNPI